MNWVRTLGLLAVVLVGAGVGLVAATLLTLNGLFVDSAWQAPALVTLLALLGFLAVFAAVGRPWGRGVSTPYW